MRIGVDTGGTFTDCVIADRGEIKILKVFSTPDNAAQAIMDGVRLLVGKRGVSSFDIIHGTTLGTNSLLERRGARVALVTTAGFEDLIEIGRQNRPRLYDLNVQRDPPLVPRDVRFGVRERTAVGGVILQRPSATELRRLRSQIRCAAPESIALCCLFSFANPANEQDIARHLGTLGIPISVSHEILPEFREYERLSTVVINAYLAPRMGAYLANLAGAAGEGFALPARHSREPGGLPYAGRGRVYVMQSSGGITTADRAAREPVRTILSGPAGGVVAAAWHAAHLGIQRAISFDMGGTSTDVCLMDGRPRMTHETTLGGLPVAVPVLDVHSVGAGGGSIARFDAGGALRVGPESAGAVPGPICYGRGATLPTVTDAHLLLGRLDAEHFLGGEFRLDTRQVEDRFREFLRGSRSTLTTPLELARGIAAVANANMERALRVISVERGHDPRDFTLIAFGGAGGLHAADLARSLGLRQVVIPRNPGAFSALGILTSDIVKDVSRSVLLPVPQRDREFRQFLASLRVRFQRLEREGRDELRREHRVGGRPQSKWHLDVRYRGQAYELPVAFTPDFPATFHREHQRAYGYAHSGRPLEAVNLRVRLTILTPKPPARGLPAIGNSDLAQAQVEEKPVWFDRRFWRTTVYEREKLSAGTRLRGPAVIVEYSSTTVVPPDFACRVDGNLSLFLNRHQLGE